MKIASVDAYALNVSIFREFKVSFGRLEHHRIYLRVRADSGEEGWGETGHFLPAYSGERWESAMAHLDYIAPHLLGRDPRDIGRIHDLLDALLHGNVQLKCAIDVALYDLWARASEVPLHKLFGGAIVDRLETQLDISVGTKDEVLADVDRAVRMGVKSVGLKVGRPASPSVEADVEIVRAVRSHFGPDLEIWADCNAGYSRIEAVRFIQAVEPCDIRLVEQPVPAWDLEGMAWVAAEVATPIVADESVWDYHDVYRIAQMKAADVIHAKLAKSGGLFGTAKLATVCESVGLPLTVACLAMLDYGQAALMHFIVSQPSCQFFRSKLRGGGLFFPEDVVQNRIRFENGVFFLPEGNGVGLEIDESRVQATAIASRTYAYGRA